MSNIIHNLRRFAFSKTFINAIILFVLVVPCISLAETCVPGSGKLCNPLKYDSFTALINAVLDIVILIGGPVAALFIVYAGFMFVTSGGDPKKLDTAKTMFWWTIIGTALILGAKVILTLLMGTITDIIK